MPQVINKTRCFPYYSLHILLFHCNSLHFLAFLITSLQFLAYPSISWYFLLGMLQFQAYLTFLFNSLHLLAFLVISFQFLAYPYISWYFLLGLLPTVPPLCSFCGKKGLGENICERGWKSLETTMKKLGTPQGTTTGGGATKCENVDN